MDAKRLAEALSPEETTELIVNLPIDVLKQGIEARAEVDSFETRRSIVESSPLVMLKAELLSRGELTADLGRLVTELETAIENDEFSDLDEYKTFVDVVIKSHTIARLLLDRIQASRKDLVVVGADKFDLSRRQIGDLFGLTAARIQQLADDALRTDPSN